jgi:hypothetical protein
MQDPKTWKDVKVELYLDLFNVYLEYVLPDKLEMKKSFNDVIYSIDSLNMCPACGRIRWGLGTVGLFYNLSSLKLCARLYTRPETCALTNRYGPRELALEKSPPYNSLGWVKSSLIFAFGFSFTYLVSKILF